MAGKTHPITHSDTLILKPTSSFLSVPCFVYCTFSQLGNKWVEILKITSSFSIASCSAVICKSVFDQQIVCDRLRKDQIIRNMFQETGFTRSSCSICTCYFLYPKYMTYQYQDVFLCLAFLMYVCACVWKNKRIQTSEIPSCEFGFIPGWFISNVGTFIHAV